MNYYYQQPRPNPNPPSIFERIKETVHNHPRLTAAAIGLLVLRPALPLPLETEVADAIAAVATIEERREVCEKPGKWSIRYLGGPAYCIDLTSVSKAPAMSEQEAPDTDAAEPEHQIKPEPATQPETTPTSQPEPQPQPETSPTPQESLKPTETHTTTGGS